MKKENKPKLSEELSDLVDFILRQGLYSSHSLDMFTKSERFAMYGLAGNKFIKERAPARAVYVFTQEGRSLTDEETKQIGDLYFDAQRVDRALFYYEKVPELIPVSRFDSIAHHYLSLPTFDLEKAIQCSKLANIWISPLTFTGVAERFIDKGDVLTADKLYHAAGKDLEKDIDIDKKELIKIGNKLLTQENIDGFRKIYQLAKEELPIKKMLKQADKCLDKYRQNKRMSSLDNAFNLYFIAENESSNRKTKEKLAEIAELYFEHGEPIRAAGILKNIGRQASFEKLIEVGDKYFNAPNPVNFPKENLDLAITSYNLAKEQGTLYKKSIVYEKLRQVADEFLHKGYLAKADMIYRTTGEGIPKEKLVHAGKRAIIEGQFEGAQTCYEMAGEDFPMQEVIKRGDHLVDSYPDDAMRAYEFAYEKIPEDKMLALGKSFLKKAAPSSGGTVDTHYTSRAIPCFKAIGRTRTAEFLKKHYGE
ncbi:hypothetical protein KY348_06080 [Candidatus Woesearchaeota archaeon]|nr:hypothetical protein [Candidatus Woesearchaeota archaeon]